MDSEMFQKACILAKDFFTLLALIRLLAKMDFLMSDKVWTSLKGFPTLMTLMTLLSRVDFLMSSKTRTLTHFRFTELFSPVWTFMLNQVWVLDEPLPTFWAFIVSLLLGLGLLPIQVRVLIISLFAFRYFPRWFHSSTGVCLYNQLPILNPCLLTWNIKYLPPVTCFLVLRERNLQLGGKKIESSHVCKVEMLWVLVFA